MLPLFSEGTKKWTVYPFIGSGEYIKTQTDVCQIVSEINTNHHDNIEPKNVSQYMGDTCNGYVVKSENGGRELWKMMSDDEIKAHLLIVEDWVNVSKHIGKVEIKEVKLNVQQLHTYSVLVLRPGTILIYLSELEKDWFYWKRRVGEFFLTLEYIASKGIILSKYALDDCIVDSNGRISLATLHNCCLGSTNIAHEIAGEIACDLLVFLLSFYFTSIELEQLLKKINFNIGKTSSINEIIKELENNKYPNFDFGEDYNSDED